MTRVIFRLSYDDGQKLTKIFDTFGRAPFAISNLTHGCLPELTSSETQRWNSRSYIVKVGKIQCKKYAHPVNLWRLSERVVNRIAKKQEVLT
jgi:hypothetical protein